MAVDRYTISVALPAALICALCLGCATGPASKTLSKTDKAQLLIQAANGALQEGDPTAALKFLQEAESMGGTELAELHHARALAYFAKKDAKTALQCERKAAELRPDNSPINNTLGKLLLDSGAYAEAENHLKRAADDPLYRETFKANTNLGILYYRTGAFAKSLQRLNKAIEESSANACIAYYYRGHIFLQDGNFKKATKDYDKATQRMCAGFADAHLALGIALERDKQYDRARKKFLDVKNSFPETQVAEQAMEHLRYLP